MFPYIHIGQLTISVYYTAMVLGYVMMVVLMLLKARRKIYGLGRIKAFIFATAELIFGVLGCKILFILENIAWTKSNGLTLGGFSFYGSVFLIPLTMPLVGKILKLNFRESLDNAAICIIAMLGTIRIGCYFNGCCGGKVLFIGDYSFTLPTQLIECVCDILVLWLLLRLEKKKKAEGFLYPIFMLLYGAARFFIEIIRNTDKDWFGLSHAQWFSIAAVAIGLTCEIIRRKKAGRITPESDISA